jgi:hypothetical protein
MFRPITSLLLLGLLLATHAGFDICGIRGGARLRDQQKVVSTVAAGMQGMAHGTPVAQTAGRHSIQRECHRSHCDHEELTFLSNRERGFTVQTIGARLCPLPDDFPSQGTLIAGPPRQDRRSPLRTSSSPASILNIRV